MQNSKVIGVFGANGFIGRHLVRRLSASGVRTIAFGRRFTPDFHKVVPSQVETRLVDITDELETQVLLQDVTHVVQLVNSSNPAIGNLRVVPDIKSNVAPQVAFIESCIMAGVQSFIFLSSGGTVYGIPRMTPIPEDHPTEPLNSYGLTKLTLEHYLRMLSRGSRMGYTTLRVSNPFGPGQVSVKGQGLIATILRQYSAGDPVNILGDGKAERDYIYIDDAVDAIVRALKVEPLNDVVNVGSGQGRSILDVVAAVERALGKPIMRMFVENRPTDTPSNVLDISKARSLLGWSPGTSFGESIRLTVDGYI